MSERTVNERDLSLLHPDMATALARVLEGLGQPMLVYCALRSPWTQARLWRQSRSTRQIERAAANMRDSGAEWLADVLMDVGPQHGRKVTNALPGLSWHQWGLAVDAVPLRDGETVWGTRGADGALWEAWRDAAEHEGLTSGASWGDWPHVQLLPEGSPLVKGDWASVDREMRERWADGCLHG